MRDARIFRVSCTLFLLVGLLAAPAAEATVDGGPITYEGNLRCSALGLEEVYKADFDKAPASGVDPSGRVGWVVYDSEMGEAVDWTSTVPIAAVLVKGGRIGGNMYPYDGAYGDVGLHTPMNPSGTWADVSHITFCAGAEPEPGMLTIAKTTDPAGAAAVFDFRSSIAGFAPALADGQSDTAEVMEGRYTVTELPVEGWELADVTCDTSGALVDLAAGTVEVDVTEGTHVTCVFENVESPVEPEPGTLVIEKVTDPPDEDVTFRFFTSVDGFRPVLGHGDSASVAVDAGEYTITEKPEHAWSLTSIACDGGDPIVDVDAGTATVQVDAGQTVTCTFTNSRWCPVHGWIAVEKITDPVDATAAFSFDSDIVDREEVPFLPTLHHGETDYVMVNPGTYHITELASAGWTLRDLTCDDPETVIDLEAATATLTVSSSEIVRCTFTNEEVHEPGTLVVEKLTEPSGAAGTFDFTSTVDGFAPSLSHGEDASVAVEAGSYTVTETPQPGWELAGVSCDDAEAELDVAGGAATVYVPEGGVVRCTFTNREIPDEPMGRIVIEKVTDPSDATETFAFETTVTEWAPELGNGESSEVIVEPGEYTITETMKAGWYLSDLTCNDPDALIDLQGTAVVDVADGETVTCTFTNTQLGTLWVGKSTGDSDDSVYFAFTSDIAGWPPDLHGGMSASHTVEPGTYTVTELAEDGWELTNITCDVPGAVIDLVAGSATVEVGAGEFVRCQFTNAELPMPGAIGDYVWDDKDRDGVQEAGEPGIEGVRINLYAAGNPQVAQGATGVLVATARTDVDGRYLIDNLPAGEYIVEFSNLPTGYRWTKQFAVADKHVDSDAGLTTGMTPVMVLPAGFVDLTCDAGAYIVRQEVLPLTGADLDWDLGTGLALLLIGTVLVLAVKPRSGIG